MTTTLMIALTIISIGILLFVICCSFGILSAEKECNKEKKIENQENNKNQLSELREKLITSQGTFSNNEQIGFKKWYFRYSFYEDSIQRLFMNAKAISFNPFSLNQINNDPYIYKDRIVWHTYTYVHGYDCFDLNSFSADHPLKIVFDRKAKLYNISFSNKSEYRTKEDVQTFTVKGFSSKKEVEEFMNMSYKYFLLRDKQQELESKKDREEILRNLP